MIRTIALCCAVIIVLGDDNQYYFHACLLRGLTRVPTSGTKRPSVADISGPLLHVDGFIDRAFQLKQGLGSAAASIVVINMVLFARDWNLRYRRRHIGALPAARAFFRVGLFINGEEVCCGKLRHQRLDGLRPDLSCLHVFRLKTD